MRRRFSHPISSIRWAPVPARGGKPAVVVRHRGRSEPRTQYRQPTPKRLQQVLKKLLSNAFKVHRPRAVCGCASRRPWEAGAPNIPSSPFRASRLQLVSERVRISGPRIRLEMQQDQLLLFQADAGCRIWRHYLASARATGLERMAEDGCSALQPPTAAETRSRTRPRR